MKILGHRITKEVVIIVGIGVVIGRFLLPRLEGVFATASEDVVGRSCGIGCNCVPLEGGLGGGVCGPSFHPMTGQAVTRCSTQGERCTPRIAIRPTLPHQHPTNQQQVTANKDAEMLHGAKPDIFTNTLDTIGQGLGRILQGRNVITDEPIIGAAEG